MFALHETDVRLQNVNVRPELHGEDPVTAVDLKCQAKLPNDRLALLDKDLKRIFYRRDDDKPDLFDGDDSEHLTRRRFPQIGVIGWEHELSGATALFTVYGNLKDQFQEAWYWSCEQRASTASYAWDTGFLNGLQNYDHEDGSDRARAVRRIVIR